MMMNVSVMFIKNKLFLFWSLDETVSSGYHMTELGPNPDLCGV
jgi:hypothetical protein